MAARSRVPAHSQCRRWLETQLDGYALPAAGCRHCAYRAAAGSQGCCPAAFLRTSAPSLAADVDGAPTEFCTPPSHAARSAARQPWRAARSPQPRAAGPYSAAMRARKHSAGKCRQQPLMPFTITSADTVWVLTTGCLLHVTNASNSFLSLICRRRYNGIFPTAHLPIGLDSARGHRSGTVATLRPPLRTVPAACARRGSAVRLVGSLGFSQQPRQRSVGGSPAPGAPRGASRSLARRVSNWLGAAYARARAW